jgi:beta-glucanase (GH16 family)
MPIDVNNLAGTAVMTFDDEFNSLNLWNGTSGTWDTNYWYNPVNGAGSTLSSNGEQEWYINSNYGPTSSVKPWSVSNGVLSITAAPASPAISSLIDNYQYTSGSLNTYYSFSQTYGYFEVDAKLPAGQGLWPAFWLMPENGSWPPELDVMEMLGNNPSTIYTTVHSTTLAGNQEAQADAVANTTTSFNTYGVDWEPNFITWYFDGQPIYKVATPADLDTPMYMILNLAVGGYWPGAANSTTPFPATMQVNWIRAYQSLSAAQAAGAVDTPAPTTLQAQGSAITLSGSAGWTSAAMLSNGEVVLGEPQSTGVGAGLIYDGVTGSEVGSPVQLYAWTGGGTNVATQVSSLGDGYWKVSYAGVGAPTDWEIYDGAGDRVLVDNVFTAGAPVFSPLDGGGFVLANSANSVFYESASGAAAWLSDAVVGGQVTAPTSIQPLTSGGFVFEYAGSTQLDVYNGAGAHVATAQLGAAVSDWATVTGSAALPSGQLAEAWLSPPADGSANMELTVQIFNADGSAATKAAAVALDADPWHSQIQVMATGQADQAVMLWSQGGAVWGAFDDAGTVSAPRTLGVGSLSGMTETALSDGNVALAWTQTDNGVQDVWAEVLNTSTMTVSQHLMGAGSSQIHLVSTGNGGFAASWHDGAAIEAMGYAAGVWTQAMGVSGDFVGVDLSGDVVAIGPAGSGGAMLQHYQLSAASGQ